MRANAPPTRHGSVSDTRLTVCYPVNYLGFGGAERQLVELVNGLDKERFRAIVVTLFPGGLLEKEIEGQPGVTLHSLNRGSKFNVKPILALARLLRDEGVHIVQPFLSPASLFGLGAGILARTPIRIATERCGQRKNRSLGNRLYRYTEDRLSRIADVAVPNSEAGREYLAGRGISRSKIRVIYNGINPNRFEADPARIAELRETIGAPPCGPVLGTVASLTRPKDQATLLRAAAALLKDYPDLRVVLVGDGNLRQELSDLAGDSGIDENVIFLGNQDPVADAIATFDVAVLPSADNEGCSNFLLEAMGMSKPLVATDVGGNRELVTPGENGLLVPVGDAVAMAHAIDRIIGDPQLGRAMGSAGKSLVADRFSLAGMIEAYSDLYMELAREKLGLGEPRRKVAA